MDADDVAALGVPPADLLGAGGTDATHPPLRVAEQYPRGPDDEPQISAYAKLAGHTWTYFITKTVITIGRASEVEEDPDVDLGPTKTVSRRHAVIQFNHATAGWEVAVTGRNGLKVNGTVFKPADPPVALHHGDKIWVGGEEFIFWLPTNPADAANDDAPADEDDLAPDAIAVEEGTDDDHGRDHDHDHDGDDDGTYDPGALFESSYIEPALVEQPPAPKPRAKKRGRRRATQDDEVEADEDAAEAEAAAPVPRTTKRTRGASKKKTAAARPSDGAPTKRASARKGSKRAAEHDAEPAAVDVGELPLVTRPNKRARAAAVAAAATIAAAAGAGASSNPFAEATQVDVADLDLNNDLDLLDFEQHMAETAEHDNVPMDLINYEPRFPSPPAFESLTPAAIRADFMRRRSVDYSDDRFRDIKPPYSYATLIAEAINSSDIKAMSLSEIYQFISDQYAYFRHATHSWQNSVRHNLSLNRAFQKVARPANAAVPKGKGCLWRIDPAHAHELTDEPKRPKRKAAELYGLDANGNSALTANYPQHPPIPMHPALAGEFGPYGPMYSSNFPVFPPAPAPVLAHLAHPFAPPPGFPLPQPQLPEAVLAAAGAAAITPPASTSTTNLSSAVLLPPVPVVTTPAPLSTLASLSAALPLVPAPPIPHVPAPPQVPAPAPLVAVDDVVPVHAATRPYRSYYSLYHTTPDLTQLPTPASIMNSLPKVFKTFHAMDLPPPTDAPELVLGDFLNRGSFARIGTELNLTKDQVKQNHAAAVAAAAASGDVVAFTPQMLPPQRRSVASAQAASRPSVGRGGARSRNGQASRSGGGSRAANTASAARSALGHGGARAASTARAIGSRSVLLHPLTMRDHPDANVLQFTLTAPPLTASTPSPSAGLGPRPVAVSASTSSLPMTSTPTTAAQFVAMTTGPATTAVLAIPLTTTAAAPVPATTISSNPVRSGIVAPPRPVTPIPRAFPPPPGIPPVTGIAAPPQPFFAPRPPTMYSPSPYTPYYTPAPPYGAFGVAGYYARMFAQQQLLAQQQQGQGWLHKQQCGLLHHQQVWGLWV
ncbi:transcription factor [Allomyces arbusculus]|nr:transcription factor [Allomyces arbusculus]